MHHRFVFDCGHNVWPVGVITLSKISRMKGDTQYCEFSSGSMWAAFFDYPYVIFISKAFIRF